MSIEHDIFKSGKGLFRIRELYRFSVYVDESWSTVNVKNQWDSSDVGYRVNLYNFNIGV